MNKRKACAHPGCPTAHREEGSYCAKHKKPTNRPDIASRHERGYTNEWARASRKYLRDHLWCVCAECKKSPRGPRRANVVDHIKPHKGDMKLFWDRRNWQALNNRCHGVKTVESDGGFGNEM